jgi:hypothetical protein
MCTPVGSLETGSTSITFDTCIAHGRVIVEPGSPVAMFGLMLRLRRLTPSTRRDERRDETTNRRRRRGSAVVMSSLRREKQYQIIPTTRRRLEAVTTTHCRHDDD